MARAPKPKRLSKDDNPTVIVRMDESRYVRSLIIDCCPHCGQRHSHGGGLTSEPPALGHRAAHCQLEDTGLGYVLVLGDLDGK